MLRPIALIALGLATASQAQEKPQKLLPLQRLTVGPNDNFQGAVDEKETILFYTRSENLSSQIMRLDLKTGIAAAVTPFDADAKSPALSPDGKNLAINYFKKDAKGDICLVRGDDVDCISKRNVADHSPVWIGPEKLAYLSSDDLGVVSQLKIYDLGSKKTEELFKGELYSPDLSPDGRTLVYKGKKNELVLFDLQSRKASRSILVDLPGITGPARFSADGKFLYIAQYMQDTNRDLLIDGRDASAIFRYDLSIADSRPPVQITSLAQNCSYPYPAKNALYMTCAFEGALDVYRGPLAGTVPTEWTVDDLKEAHQVARSYFDRVLFLNQLYTRFNTMSEIEFQDRSFQNFLYAGEYLPAAYYLERRLEKGNGEKNKLSSLLILMNSFARWEVMPEKRNLGAFAQFIAQQKQDLAKLGKGPDQQLVQAYLDFFSSQTDKALANASSLSAKDEVELFLQANLVRLVLQQKSPERYRQFLADKVLNRTGETEENRLFYLSLWLQELPEGKDPGSAISALKPKVAGSMLELLDNEIDLYKLTQSTTKDAERENYRSIVARVKRLKDQYYSMRLLFNRSIIVLYQSKRTRNMADIVSLWLSYLKRDSKEHPFAIEAMRQNSLDLAYQFMHSQGKDKAFAGGAFFDSIRSSDDLESHFQYALLNFGKWDELRSNYKQMVQQGLIRAESLEFVETVRKILAKPEAASKDDLAEAAEKVKAIRDDHVGAGEKYLFLGYLYQRQIEAKGFKVDRELVEKAHRAYLFAIDAALNNDRIQASALQNLGLLHLKVRNASLAAEFFSKRDDIPYDSAEEQVAVLWLKAKALYLSYRFVEAAAAMEEALKLKPSPIAAFEEKAAFYSWNAGQYAKALTHYEARLAADPNAGPATFLGYGYALRKAGKEADAAAQFKKVVSLSPGKDIKKADAPSLIVQPVKLRFIALGLIAQSESLPGGERLAALRDRIALFPALLDDPKTLHFDAETLQSQRIKELQDQAFLELKEGKRAEAEKTLGKSIEFTEEFAGKSGYLNNTAMTALKNGWIFAQGNKLSTQSWAAKAKTIQEGVDKEFADQKTFTALVTKKWAEFKLIQFAYGSPGKDYAAESKGLFQNSALQALEKDKPDLYLALGRYRDAVQKAL